MSNFTKKAGLMILLLLTAIVGFAADGSYFRTIKKVLPIPTPAGKTYSNEAVTVEYPFEGTTTDPVNISPDDAVSMASLTTGDEIKYVKSGAANGITYALFQPVRGAG